MGCSSHELMEVLSTHRIQASKDTITKTLTLERVIDARDALAKFIYASLFDWLVKQVNKSLEVGKCRNGRSICILYIYGFKSFQDYELDGIHWTKVDFKSNQKPLGLLPLLNKESNFPKASDPTLANKLKQQLHDNPCFKGERGRAFSVCHYVEELIPLSEKRLGQAGAQCL
ncbi:Myosin-2 [Glycine soja]